MIKKYKQDQIEELASILKNDGVICVPTDTVYGVCARINSKKARDKLMELKKRPTNKSIPIMCANVEQIKNIGIVNDKVEEIIHNFMPGPITLVLLRKSNLPKYINEGSVEVGVRMATSKLLEQLIQKVGSPLFMTSANISGEPTCQTIEEIKKTFPNLDGILEGEIPKGQASTILDCTSNEIKVLRQGPISLEQIKKACKYKTNVDFCR